MNTVPFSDWEKLDLRTGKIIEIDEIPGADKLYKLKVDLGKEKRTLVAGLKQHYKKEDLKNKKVIVFCNLEPRKLKGIESQGMILAAVNEDHSKVHLIQPDREIELGSQIS
ncbi:methionine--tRNA ligase subunit beta [Candidatus Pacearchaeota archaeon]|nr:methionine--tRNA ligase subunit beta [Candidatus Pacearchaeota archaeon]